MNETTGQRVDGGNLARRPVNRRFFGLMAFFVGSFLFLAYVGVRCNDEFGRLTGSVVDAASGQPIQGAKVTIRGIFPNLQPEKSDQMKFDRASISDAAGRFQLSTVKGQFRFGVTCLGYLDVEQAIEMNRKETRDLGAVKLTRVD